MTTYNYPVIQGEKTGRRLRKLRKDNGMKVPAVCDCLGGISEQAVYKWERGECLPSIDNLLALSHLYNVQIEELLVYEEVVMTSIFLPLKRLLLSFSSLENSCLLFCVF